MWQPLPLLWDADVDANLYPVRLKAAKQQNQKKKLFSDIVIRAFRCNKMYPE